VILAPLDQRQKVLDRARSETFDVVVVGGGINGVGIALDAVSRGLSVLILERDDLAVGTSSRSSKLIHGGLRYLEQYRFGLVREALGERALLRRLAPHIVGMERFVFPVFGSWWQVPYVGAGLTLYQLLGGSHGGKHRRLGPELAIERIPDLSPMGLRGGYEYADGVFDDARLVVAVARAAIANGAGALTRAEVTGTETGAGGVIRVGVHDRLEGSVFEVGARTVVDATGAFSADHEPGVVASRGVHIVVPRERIEASTGMTIKIPGRVVFLIPWLDRWLIGTTDVPHTGPVDRPGASGEEVRYLLDLVNTVLQVGLGPSDIISTFAGIRPLADDGESDETAELSREEKITEPEPGVFRVRGGKYTTYRQVAQRAVDRVAARLGAGAPSMTNATPVPGAASAATLVATERELVGWGVAPDIVNRLVRRHGVEAVEVTDTARSLGLTGRLAPDLPYLEVEAWWAVHREQALGIDDVVSRRTRIALETPDHGEQALGTVAEVLGGVLGWDRERRAQEVKEFMVGAVHEYGIPELEEGT
jgi:glycerol-3-phosphate dehydrogenase